MRRIGQKNNTPAKQPFMFHYRCFLLRCWLKSTPPAAGACGILKTPGEHCGFRRSLDVETSLVPMNLADYRRFLRILTFFCQKNGFWAVICMGNEVPSDKRPLSPVEALARENPTQLMAQLRAFWPQVQEALKASHTLRLIHKRLNLAGVPISYKLLSLYRGSIERRRKGLAPSASPNSPLPARSPDGRPSAHMR